MILGQILFFAVSIVPLLHAEEASAPSDIRAESPDGQGAPSDAQTAPPGAEESEADQDESTEAESGEASVAATSGDSPNIWHPPGIAPPVVVYPVETYTLANGLEVVLQPDSSHPRVAVSVTYVVGERDQPEGLRGLVQVVEELMGRGSRNVDPGGHDRHFDRAGATDRGSLITHDDSTFFEEIPSNHLATALWLESDRMASLLAVVDREAVEAQRAQLDNERTLALSRNALHGLDEAVARVLYPASHPYRRIGDSESELSRVRLEHVRSFFQRWYAPNNARLAIVGDFEVSAARALIEQYFGTISSSFSTPPADPRQQILVLCPAIDG